MSAEFQILARDASFVRLRVARQAVERKRAEERREGKSVPWQSNRHKPEKKNHARILSICAVRLPHYWPGKLEIAGYTLSSRIDQLQRAKNIDLPSKGCTLRAPVEGEFIVMMMDLPSACREDSRYPMLSVILVRRTTSFFLIARPLHTQDLFNVTKCCAIGCSRCS